MARSTLIRWIFIQHIPGQRITPAYVMDDFGNAHRVLYNPIVYRDGAGL